MAVEGSQDARLETVVGEKATLLFRVLIPLTSEIDEKRLYGEREIKLPGHPFRKAFSDLKMIGMH